MSREAMKMALEALEWNYNTDLDNIPACEQWAKMLKKTITALRQAIEQAEQAQPVAWRDMAYANLGAVRDKMPSEQVTAVQDWLEKVYTAPLKREWFDCTDEQLIDEVRRRGFVIRDAQIEQAEHVHAVNTSQERVDEMVKTEHDKQIEIAQAYERGWNAALAQQEPVACIGTTGELMWLDKPKVIYSKPIPLYTAPPEARVRQELAMSKPSTKIFGPSLEEILNSAGFYRKREWVGLTDEEVSEIINREIGFNSCWGPEETFARAVEVKLKEKNT